MRINQFVAKAIGLSRRDADSAIKQSRVQINNQVASLGQIVENTDKVSFDNHNINISDLKTIVLVNKPIGYVCSKEGQGSLTLYDLIPAKYGKLNHVGRLDKDSSGLIVLTNDGKLAHYLSHPSFNNSKIYEVELDIPLQKKDLIKIENGNVTLEGRPSRMKLKIDKNNTRFINVEIHEGRNRQIRRTFQKLGYTVIRLQRVVFGPYQLSLLGNKRFIEIQ